MTLTNTPCHEEKQSKSVFLPQQHKIHQITISVGWWLDPGRLLEIDFIDNLCRNITGNH